MSSSSQLKVPNISVNQPRFQGLSSSRGREAKIETQGTRFMWTPTTTSVSFLVGNQNFSISALSFPSNWGFRTWAQKETKRILSEYSSCEIGQRLTTSNCAADRIKSRLLQFEATEEMNRMNWRCSKNVLISQWHRYTRGKKKSEFSQQESSLSAFRLLVGKLYSWVIGREIRGSWAIFKDVLFCYKKAMLCTYICFLCSFKNSVEDWRSAFLHNSWTFDYLDPNFRKHWGWNKLRKISNSWLVHRALASQ